MDQSLFRPRAARSLFLANTTEKRPLPAGKGPIHSELRSKTFPSTLATVFVSFSPIHTKTLENDETDWDLGLRMSVTSLEHGMRPFLRHRFQLVSCDAFSVTVFKSLCFHLSRLEILAFLKRCVVVSTFETVFESLRFQRRFSMQRWTRRFSMQRWTHQKVYAFSNMSFQYACDTH